MMAIINFIAVLGPEIGFDALWYQLTLPKLWLLKHQWYFPGGLLYYSPMPRLGGVIFIPFMMLWNENGAKLVQFIAGIGASAVIYKTARIKFDTEKSLMAACAFYITNIVSWQSGSAYIDLIRTFFEISAFYFAVSDQKSDWLTKNKFLAGIFIGLAVGTKWQAVLTLLMLSVWFSPLIFIIGLVVASPWIWVAFHFTNNPIFPIFETFMSQIQLREVGPVYFDLSNVLRRVISVPWQFIAPYDDHSNPTFFIVLLLLVFCVKNFKDKFDRSILVFCLAGLLIWQITPPPSTRYFLPYLPYLSIASIYVLQRFAKLKYLFLGSFLLVLLMRAKANTKYLPYIARQETKSEFLKNHINLTGTFIDENDEIKKRFDGNKRYLVDGFSGLYYFPFNFDHSSWATDINDYDYLVTNRESIWGQSQLIFENDSGMKIYKKTPK
jgi:hypothetical protein